MSKSRTVKEYEQQLTELRKRLLRMAGRVEQMIAQAIEALVDGNRELAEQTIEADRQVNLDEMETDDLCLVILAKRQPMAGDLRFITVALKMVTDLERIGDLAVNICLESIDQKQYRDTPPLGDIPRMGQIVQDMVTEAIDAFVDRDADAARAIIARDDEVDALNAPIDRRLIEHMRHTDGAIEASTSIQAVVEHLERMADHTTNLAEKVIFMVDGEDVRHRDKLAGDWSGRGDL